MERNDAILIAALVTTIAVSIGIIVVASWLIRSGGRVVAVGVMCDTAEIYWGDVISNSSYKKVIRCWSNGTIPLILNMSAVNWEPPEAANYLSYTWDYTGEPVGTTPLPIAITLHVSADVEGIDTFYNDLLISAEESR